VRFEESIQCDAAQAEQPAQFNFGDAACPEFFKGEKLSSA
jgi:hypothetical protein